MVVVQKLERLTNLPTRWNISNIPVDRYDKLPQLRRPEGYVCLFQDSVTGNYFIGDSDHPEFLVRHWGRRAPNRYRLVRIVKADNAVELKKLLHRRYRDKWIRQHLGWFRFDNAQLRELDDFIEQNSKQLAANAMQLERWNLKYFAGDFYKHLPKRHLPAGYVYVVRDLYTENYKIGYTNHPSKRIRWLEEKASGEVEYIHILQSDQAEETETYLHERYDSFRTRAHKDWEWFRLNNAQLQEIQHLARQRRQPNQTPSQRSTSYEQNHQPRQTPAAHSPIEHSSPQVSPDTKPSKVLIPRTQQNSRVRRNLGLFLSLGIIIVAVAIGKFDLADGRLAVIHTSTQHSVRDIPSRASTNPTSLPSANNVKSSRAAAIGNKLQPTSCLFVYACPSYDCKVIGQIPSIEDMRFLQCVSGRDFKNTEWIEVNYEDDKAYLWDRDCSSKNFSETPARNSTPQETTFTCDCSKQCKEMISCAEAFFQLNECGCNYRDYDEDGIPCESICRCD